ncbi:MAG TPA: sialidase family protein [Terriglobales bacterium]|nr:sialidase family protein [Terriglobales bacterium]
MRPFASRALLFCLLLVFCAAVRVWSWRPFTDPDAVENGEEVQLAPQRVTAPPPGSKAVAPRLATFAGNPYLVGTIVTPTKTLPEAETNITVNPADEQNLAAIITDYSQRTGNIFTNGASKYAISTDGGQTWGQAFVPLSNKYPITSDGVTWLVDRDPGVAIDLSGNVYFSGLYLKLASMPTNGSSTPPINRSTTPGGVYVCAGTLPVPNLTAASCRPVVTDTSLNPTTSVDRDWIAVDSSHSPYSGTVYISWTYYTGCLSNGTCATKYIAFSKSTNHGVTWSSPIQINSTDQTIVDWSMVTVGGDGTVYVAYELYFTTGAERMHFVAVSTDGGTTFGTPIAMTPIFHNVEFTCPYRKNSAPNVVVSSVSGAEYVYDVWAEAAAAGGSAIAVARSMQPKGAGGFKTPVIINDSTAGQRQYAAGAVDGNGTLHTLWLDTRNSPADDSQYDVYATYSYDAGATFAPNARVTPALINGNTGFIGDFFGITVEPGTGVAHGVWTNGGILNGQLQTTTLTPQ